MELFVKHKSIATFIVCSLFCIISLSSQSSTFTLSVEGIVSAFVSPFQKGYDALQGGVSRFWAGFSELNDVREQLDLTREKLHRYESLTEEIAEIRNENERLRNLLGLKENIKYDSVTASIVSKDPDNWFRTLVVNRGSNDGIEVNMPVVAYSGDVKAVVGKIVEVRGSLARIQPLNSPDIKIGIKLQESGFPGLLSGVAHNSNSCVVNYMSRGAAVSSGDVVVTSGLAGVFPAGLFVGKVIESDISGNNPYQKLIVEPFIDYNLIEEVFIIKKSADKGLFELFEEKQ